MVGLVLICLVPLLIVLVWHAAQQRSQSRRDAVDDTLRLSRQAAQQESAVIDNARTLLDGAAALWTDTDDASRSCQAFVDGIQSRADQLTNVFLVGDDGRILCSAEPLPADQHLIDRPYVQSAISDGQFSAGLEQAGDLVAKPSVVAILPIANDPVVALLGATMELGGDLRSFLGAVGLPEGSEALLIDRSGKVIAMAPASGELGEVLPAESLTTQVATDQVVEGSADADGFDGVTRVYGFADIPGTSRSVFAVVGIPAEAAFADGDRELRANLIASGLVALAAVTLALIMAELAVARPVRGILGTIRKIGSGELAARTTIDGGASELVEVGRTIDVMAEDIQARERALLIASEEREHLLGELLDAQEDERRKIAADIHDDTIQTMIASGMEVQLLRMDIDQGIDPGERIGQVEHSISTAVAPPAAADLRARAPRRCDVRHRGEPRELPRGGLGRQRRRGARARQRGVRAGRTGPPGAVPQRARVRAQRQPPRRGPQRHHRARRVGRGGAGGDQGRWPGHAPW